MDEIIRQFNSEVATAIANVLSAAFGLVIACKVAWCLATRKVPLGDAARYLHEFLKDTPVSDHELQWADNHHATKANPTVGDSKTYAFQPSKYPLVNLWTGSEYVSQDTAFTRGELKTLRKAAKARWRDVLAEREARIRHQVIEKLSEPA